MHIITGGAGFIGSALAAEFNKTSVSDILIVDHLGNSEKWKNLRNLKFDDYLEKDIFLENILANKFESKKIETIIHFGACSSTTETDCSYLVKNNYEYTKRLAEYTLKNNIRFIYASSAATYGAGEQGYIDDENSLEKLQPLNMYGYSKQMFDLYAKRAGILNKIAGLKFFNVYGPNEYHKGDMRSVVHKAYYQIKEIGKVNLFKSYKSEYGDGEQMRDFVYIKEAVSKVMRFIEQPELNGIFNIGSGKANTWNALVTSIFTALNLKPNINYIEMPEYLRDKYQYFTEADMIKFDKLTNANKIEKFTIEKGVFDYVNNYLQKDAYL